MEIDWEKGKKAKRMEEERKREDVVKEEEENESCLRKKEWIGSERKQDIIYGECVVKKKEIKYLVESLSLGENQILSFPDV